MAFVLYGGTIILKMQSFMKVHDFMKVHYFMISWSEPQFTTATAFLEPTTQTPLRCHALECSHRPAFVILPRFVELQLCFQATPPPSNSDFQLGHVFMKQTVVTLATPSVKRKSLCPNSPPQPSRKFETSWKFMYLWFHEANHRTTEPQLPQLPLQRPF